MELNHSHFHHKKVGRICKRTIRENVADDESNKKNMILNDFSMNT